MEKRTFSLKPKLKDYQNFIQDWRMDQAFQRYMKKKQPEDPKKELKLNHAFQTAFNQYVFILGFALTFVGFGLGFYTIKTFWAIGAYFVAGLLFMITGYLSGQYHLKEEEYNHWLNDKELPKRNKSLLLGVCFEGAMWALLGLAIVVNCTLGLIGVSIN